jgi:hypothetical protein
MIKETQFPKGICKTALPCLISLFCLPAIASTANGESSAQNQPAETPQAPQVQDRQWGLHLNTGRYFGEFGLKDHYGPWIGYGLGIHRQTNEGNRAKLVYGEFNYHKANTLYFFPWQEDPKREVAIENFLVVNAGMDYQWLWTGTWQKGTYWGLGGALSLAQWKDVEANGGSLGGRGGYIGPQVSGKVGIRFNRHAGVEARLSLARYAHITAPGFHLSFSFRR